MDVIVLYAREFECLLEMVENGAICPLKEAEDIVRGTGYCLEDVCNIHNNKTARSRWGEEKTERLKMLIEIVYGLLLRLSGGDPLTGEHIKRGHRALSHFVFDHLTNAVQKDYSIKHHYVTSAILAASRGLHQEVLEYLTELLTEGTKTRACHNKSNVRGNISHASARFQEISDRFLCMHGYYGHYGLLSDSE